MPFMRLHIALVAAILIGSAVTVFFFPFPAALAVPGTRMNISQMHIDHPNMKNLPVSNTKLHDMSFVFSEGD
jgi:hypothetical protein